MKPERTFAFQHRPNDLGDCEGNAQSRCTKEGQSAEVAVTVVIFPGQAPTHPTLDIIPAYRRKNRSDLAIDKGAQKPRLVNPPGLDYGKPPIESAVPS
jgi:hypothetical protein